MAIRFDAASDRLLATANLLSNEGPYSWGGDIYWVSASGSDEALFVLNNDVTETTDSRDHIYIKNSDSTLRVFIGNGSGGYGFGTGSTLSTGTWYNIFVVRASATDIRVYLNGTLDITVTNDMSGRSSFTRQEIGGFTSTDLARFNGRVQNILSLDGIELSAAEVMSQSKRFYPIRLGTSTNRWTPAVQTGTDRSADWIGKYSWTVSGTLTDEEGQPKAWGSGQRRHYIPPTVTATPVTFFGGIGAGVVGRLTA